MRSYPFVLALLFVSASLLLLGGRVAPAGAGVETKPTAEPLLEAAAPAPASEPLVVTAAGPAGSGLTLQTTVDLNSDCIGATEALTVAAGTQVTFCYRVTNNTGFTLTAHTLHDALGQNLLSEFTTALPNGASTTHKRTVAPAGSLTNLATWSITQPITGYTVGNFNCADYPTVVGGQALHLGDDEMVNLTLPFHVQFYDRYTDQLRVSNNGALLFDEPNTPLGLLISNLNLPTPALPHGLAAFWDDLSDQTGDVYAGLVEVSGVSVYAIEYRSRSLYESGVTNPGSFAVMLFAPNQGRDGEAAVCYKDTDFNDAPEDSDVDESDFGASATLGVNHNGSVATLYSFDMANLALTGTFGLIYQPIGGDHAAFAASDSARVTVISTLNLPLLRR